MQHLNIKFIFANIVMRGRQETYYAALFLLTVFSLNTVVSFACSLGGLFHDLHHGSPAPSTVAHHQEGHHGDLSSHDHDQGKKDRQSSHAEKENSAANDCCSNNVLEVEKLEKSVSRTIEAPHTIFLTSLVASLATLFQLFPAQDQVFYPEPVRWRHPMTIQNLRIVIQSFQI